MVGSGLAPKIRVSDPSRHVEDCVRHKESSLFERLEQPKIPISWLKQYIWESLGFKNYTKQINVELKVCHLDPKKPDL